MGTDETSMAWIQDEIGRSVGLPPEIGGIPLDQIGATGFGLSVAIDVARHFCGLELNGARVAVQGFGSVGMHTAQFLARKGAVLVAAADSKAAVIDPTGLDIGKLIQIKRDGKSVADYDAGKKMDRDAVIDVECDIWVPAARPDVIREDNVARLKTKLVAQGANIPITAAAEAALHARSILSIPDFIANAGGVICASVEYHGGTQRQAFETIEEKIRQNTQVVLEASRAEAIPPRAAANDLARRRVEQAMAYRRWR
jgi:glutamate dehydrogenase (NAD(P)+)